MVPLKLEELEDDKVVMGEGMSFPVILERLGALGLVYRLVFLLSNFFLP